MARIRELIQAALPTPITVATPIAVAILLSACGEAPASPTITAGPTAVVSPDTGTGEGDIAGVVEEIAEAVSERTPVPTPTPGVFADKVDEITVAAGLTGRTFLGLPAEVWIDIVISLVIALVGYLLALLVVKVLFAALKRTVHHTSSEFDDVFVDSIGQEIKWLVMVLVLRYALLRLGFWSDRLRILIDDALFVLGLGVVVMMTLKVVNFAAQWYRDHLGPDVDKTRLEPLILLLQRSGYIVVLIIGASVGLSHFGIQITVLAAALILGVLALSLGATDVISDAISGFIILVDQPFRVGDVIAIEELNQWGDVIDIGLRTTRIRTRDNRMVIVPNSVIGANQVINYTYPDPQYRIETHVAVDDDTDLEAVRQLIIDTVRKVEGVLPEKPVDALYVEMGGTSMLFRVRWWLESYREKSRMIDKVHSALKHALNEAGIGYSEPTQSMDLQIGRQALEQIIRALRTEARPGAE